MKSTAVLLASALIGITGLAPAAYARHRVARPAAMMVAPATPRINAAGQFYATPISAGIGGPGLTGIPGLDLAGGLVNGAAQPLALPAGIISPVLDPVTGIVNGVTQPLLPPVS